MYITNAIHSITSLPKLLVFLTNRFEVIAGPSFYVSFLGQDSLNGPLTVNTSFDQFLDSEIFGVDIAYWDSGEGTKSWNVGIKGFSCNYVTKH